MKVYTVHAPPRRALRDDETEEERFTFVRDGFRWLAFLFPAIWLLVNRLWLPLLGFMVLSIGLALLASALGLQSIIFPLELALQLLVGLEADAIKRWSLERRGWRMLGIVSGRDEIEAEQRFFWRYAGDRAVPYSASSPGDAGLVGMFPEMGR